MKNAAYFFITAISSVLLLVYGKGILIPFIFAFLFWFLTKKLRSYFDKWRFTKRFFPRWLKNGLVFTLMTVVVLLVADILSNSIATLSDSYEDYQPNIDGLLQKLASSLGINLTEYVDSVLGDFDFGNLLGDTFSALSSIIASLFMVIIYALFIFLEESSFVVKIRKIWQDEAQYEQFNHLLSKIEKSIADYLLLKTFVSLLTGALSYVVLLLVGVDSPLFWAFLIFVLNYIPNIGSLVATTFPTVFSLIQFGTFTNGIIIFLAVGAIQLLVGNIIEPRVMGKSLNLSPLVTILALAFWGVLWGITGMILSVPITIILVIILSQFEQTKPVAILLSEKGNID